MANTEMSIAERTRVRLQRLKQELRDEGLELLEFPGTDGSTIDAEGAKELEEAVLDELLYARRTPVHEGHRAAYAAIVSHRAGFDWVGSDIGDFFPAEVSDVNALREFSDGIGTFVARDAQGAAGLLRVQRGDERSLVELCDRMGVTVIQRHPNGIIRVFGQHRLLVYDNDEWSQKPYGRVWSWPLLDYIQPPVRAREVAVATLDFCMHVLSAQHIGATLVWALTDSDTAFEGSFASEVRRLPVTIDIKQRKDLHFLRTALARLDGACLLDSDGGVLGVEAFLKTSDEAIRHVKTSGGTRHASAARFSFDHPATVVFTVSADGPVSIFSDGVRILHITEHGEWLQSMLDRIASGGVPTVERTQCRRCGKDLSVECLTLREEVAELSTISCPACHADLGFRKAEVVKIRVRKPWETGDLPVLLGSPKILPPG